MLQTTLLREKFMSVSCKMCSHYDRRQQRCRRNFEVQAVITNYSVSSLLGFCDELTLEVEKQEKKGGGP